MWEYNNDHELCHYGVLGMKWGIHRAKKKGTTYTYKSHGQKKYEKKLNKATAKSAKENRLNKLSRKLEKFKQRDANREEFARSTKVGSAIARGLLLGPSGNGTYSRMRAAGYGKAGSTLAAFIMPYPLPISRNVEFTTARRDLERRNG